jgi:hypothetical protein
MDAPRLKIDITHTEKQQSAEASILDSQTSVKVISEGKEKLIEVKKPVVIKKEDSN